MNNTNNPVYQVLKETSGGGLLRILSSLIRQQKLDKEFFTFEENNFYQTFLSREKLYRLSETDFPLLNEIIQYVEDLRIPEVSLQHHIENNKTAALTLFNDSSEALILSFLEKIKLNEISYHTEIVQALFGKNKTQCVDYVLQNYPEIDFKKISFYEIHNMGDTNGTRVAVNYKPLIEALKINTLSEFKNTYLQYHQTLDFFAPSHTRVYNKKDLLALLPENTALNTLSQAGLKDLLDKAQHIKPSFEQHTTLTNRMAEKFHSSYEGLALAHRRTRDDQKEMRNLQEQCLDFFRVLENNRINYIDESDIVRNAFNHTLITLAPYFKTATKKLLSNKRAMGALDLKVFNAKKINLSTALIRYFDYELLERVMAKKSITVNDLKYKDNYHPSASILQLFLSKEAKKISKSQVRERQAFLDKMLLNTDWASVDKYQSNLATQFLLQKTSAEGQLSYHSQNQNITVVVKEKERYSYSEPTTYAYKENMQLFSDHQVSFSQANTFGLQAQEILFDYYISSDISQVFNDFYDGNEAYGVQGYKNSTLEQQIKIFEGLSARFPKLFVSLDNDYKLRNQISRVLEKWKIMGLSQDPELTPAAMRSFVSNPQFMTTIREIAKATKDYSMESLQEFMVTLEKYELNYNMELSQKELFPEIAVKPAKKFKI